MNLRPSYLWEVVSFLLTLLVDPVTLHVSYLNFPVLGSVTDDDLVTRKKAI